MTHIENTENYTGTNNELTLLKKFPQISENDSKNKNMKSLSDLFLSFMISNVDGGGLW